MGSGRNNLRRLADDFTTYKQELRQEREEKRQLAKIEKRERQADKEAKILWELKKSEVVQSLEKIFEMYFENYPYNDVNIYLRTKSGFDKIANTVKKLCKVEKIEKSTYFSVLNNISKLYKYEKKPLTVEEYEAIKKEKIRAAVFQFFVCILNILKFIIIFPFIFITAFWWLLPHPKNKK